uniref:Virulence factor domain-containing protein n=1 Tax=Caldilinea aerophila TaxID=133453 RepID=A0A7C1FJF0_9CHLR
MASYQILYWSDIPVQVKAWVGRNRCSVPLSARFVEAVDAAAMAAGLTGSDAYTEQYRWSETQEREGSPEEVAAAVAAELEAQHPEINWRATAQRLRKQRRNNG